MDAENGFNKEGKNSHKDEFALAVLIVLIVGGAIWYFFFRSTNVEIIYERTEVTAPEFADDTPVLYMVFAEDLSKSMECPMVKVSADRFECEKIESIPINMTEIPHELWVVDKARARKDDEGSYIRKSHLVASDVYIEGTKVSLSERGGAEIGVFIMTEEDGVQ